MENTPNIYFQELFEKWERTKKTFTYCCSFVQTQTCLYSINYGEALYYIFPVHLYLVRLFFFFPPNLKIPNKCERLHSYHPPRQGLRERRCFFFCHQDKATVVFAHRCLCFREFYSSKGHCYQWLVKHRIQIPCELNPGL